MSSPIITVTPPVTTLPVQYAHAIDYFSKGIDQQGPYYRVVYYIANWSDSDTFVNALLGFSTLTGSTFGGIVVKGTPHAHPLSPNLYCQRAEATGVGRPIINNLGIPSYAGGARIEAEYRSQSGGAGSAGPYQMTGSELGLQIDQGTPALFCTQEVDLSVEMFTIPGSLMNFVGGATIPGQLFRIVVPVGHLSYTFHKLPYNPWGGPMRTLRGQVNLGMFLGADTGCILFKGAKINRSWDTSGNGTVDVTMTFAERPATMKWNWLPNPKDPAFAWAPVVGVGGGVPYIAADLSPLVQF